MSDDEIQDAYPVPQQAPKKFMDRFLKPQADTEEETFEVIPPEERKAAMRAMVKQEVTLGYIASAIALLFALGLTVPFMFGTSQVTQTAAKVNGKCPATYYLVKNVCTHVILRQPSYYILPLVIYVIFAIAIFITVRIRRRVPAAFASFIAGAAFTSTSIAIGAPLLIYGGWLYIRARRIQKFGTTDGRAAAKIAAEQRAERKSGTATKTSRTATKSSSKTQSAPGAPQASKRYTPPKPKKKKPSKSTDS